MDGVPQDSNKRIGNDSKSSPKLPPQTLKRSLDQNIPSANEILAMRQKLSARLKRISVAPAPITNTKAAMNLDLDLDTKLRAEVLNTLRRLSNPKLDTEAKREIANLFLENGFFLERENARKLSAYLNAILHDGKASFFREQNINKRAFLGFVFNARKVDSGLLTELVTEEPNKRAFDNLVLMAQETKAPKKKLGTILIMNLIQSKEALTKKDIQSLTANMDQFFGNTKSFTEVLRQILSKAQDRTDNLLTSIIDEGVNISHYEEQIKLNIEAETPDLMFNPESDTLDDPEALIKSSQKNLENLLVKYQKQRHTLDASHAILRNVLKQDIARMNTLDLAFLLDYFKVDISSLGQLAGSELEDLSVFNEVGINIFGQKDFRAFQETLSLVDQIPADHPEINEVDRFQLLSDLHHEMNDEPFLNTRFLTVLASKLIGIDSKQASRYFLESLDEFSPYAFSYDNFQFMAQHLANDPDPKIAKEVQRRLLKEYQAQLKFQPQGRSLPLTLAFVDHALSNADLSVDAEGNQSLMQPRLKTPILTKFLSNRKIDFPAMIPMLKNAADNFNAAEEENFSLISQQVQDFSFLGFSEDYDDSDLLVNQDPAKLTEKFVEAISYQTSRKQAPKDDIIAIKLLSYLNGLSEMEPELINNFKGPAKHFVDIQLALAAKADPKD